MRAGYGRTLAAANAGAAVVGAITPRNGRDNAPSPSKRAGPNVGGKTPQNGDAKTAICAALKEIFGAKPWTVLMDMFGMSEGAAKKKTHGERALSLDELRAILHREDGHHVLAALMTDASCRWWRLAAAVIQLDAEKRDAIFARRRMANLLKGALDADRSLAAAIVDAETALVFQDQDFMRPHRDAVREVAGVPDRAVAAARKAERKG